MKKGILIRYFIIVILLSAGVSTATMFIMPKFTEDAMPQQVFRDTNNAVVGIESRAGTGTGFLIEKDRISTALHVVRDIPANSWEITVTAKSETLRARVEKFDLDRDLAILELEYPLSYKPLRLVDNQLFIGQEVFAIGNSLGQYLNSFSSGVISGLDRKQGVTNLIQFDALIVSGNSGGPLLNRRGEVIGIVVQRADLFGLAVPAKYVAMLEKSPVASDIEEAEIVVDFDDLTEPSDKTFFYSPFYGRLIWENNFMIRGGSIIFNSISLRKIGEIDNDVFQNFNVYIDGEEASKKIGFDANGFLRIIFDGWSQFSLQDGVHEIKIVADIYGGNPGSFSFILEKSSDLRIVSNSYSVNRNGSRKKLNVRLTVEGDSFTPLLSETQTVIVLPPRR